MSDRRPRPIRRCRAPPRPCSAQAELRLHCSSAPASGPSGLCHVLELPQQHDGAGLSL
uniref:Uncharacterized protein n=1 Tax=Zea mays TaxID=4577 RepID=B6T290_MAIZE|nr:hypothetical protein [Zea mays]